MRKKSKKSTGHIVSDQKSLYFSSMFPQWQVEDAKNTYIITNYTKNMIALYTYIYRELQIRNILG